MHSILGSCYFENDYACWHCFWLKVSFIFMMQVFKVLTRRHDDQVFSREASIQWAERRKKTISYCPNYSTLQTAADTKDFSLRRGNPEISSVVGSANTPNLKSQVFGFGAKNTGFPAKTCKWHQFMVWQFGYKNVNSCIQVLLYCFCYNRTIWKSNPIQSSLFLLLFFWRKPAIPYNYQIF